MYYDVFVPNLLHSYTFFPSFALIPFLHRWVYRATEMYIPLLKKVFKSNQTTLQFVSMRWFRMMSPVQLELSQLSKESMRGEIRRVIVYSVINVLQHK